MKTPYKKPKKKIEFNPFDMGSLEFAIREIKRYEQSLEGRVGDVCDKLCCRGVEIAKKKLIMYDAVDTQELLDNIYAERKEENLSCIIADTDHAIYVEFGTGQMGEEGPYPYEMPKGVNWEYNVGKTIFEISEGQYGWYYPADDGTWHFTQGMPARPFMYETAMELPLLIRKVAKEVFNDA